MTTEIAEGSAGGGVRLIRPMVAINLGLAALQPVSAGFLLSGFDHAPAVHALAGVVLQPAALVQAITAVVLWRRRRVPAAVAIVSVGLVAAVFVEVWMGYSRRYWLHVPLAVAILFGLARQLGSLASPPAAAGAAVRVRDAEIRSAH